MLIRFSLLLLVILLSGCASLGNGSDTSKRQAIIAMKNEVLTELFKTKPDVRSQINAAPGYGVFTNANINLFLISAGTGYGLVKEMQTGKHTYMNMAEGGIGIGMGAKHYRIVMVFHTHEALNHFIENGWTFGGNADAAVRAEKQGASIEGEAYYGDVSVYTFTENGVAFQATIKGTKFWKDHKLN